MRGQSCSESVRGFESNLTLSDLEIVLTDVESGTNSII